MFPPENAPSAEFPYRVEQQVGVGSMGIVYKAVEAALERTVAIKVLRQSVLDEETPEVRDELRRRFLQEARAAAALSHPGVTTVYRVGEAGGRPYMVMEWLDGDSLEAVLKQRPRFAIAETARLGVALLDTLEAAHRGGVVHRDIKPSNLVLLKDGRLKVTDFGIALVKGRELVKTQAGVVLATPKFASPEQLRGLEVDGRADLFATGILLYRLLTGSFPFDGADFMGLARAILQDEPPPPRELRPDIPPAIEAVIRRALRKSRKDRFASAAEMAEELRPFAQSDGGGSPAVSRFAPTVDEELATGVASRAPVQHSLPADPRRALVKIVAESWPGRSLDRQPTADLLGRLLDKPLHAAPFAGAVAIDRIYLFIADGMLLGAVDEASGESGDAVAETLPAETAPRLHPLPESFPGALVGLLTTVLNPPRRRHADLDSSFINLPAMARKLRDEKFDGILRLSRGDAFGLIFFAAGETALCAFSEGWAEVPVEESWQRWISRVPVRASVEEQNVRPLNEWFRRAFHGFELAARPVPPGAEAGGEGGDSDPGTTSSRIRQMFQSSRSRRVETGSLALRLAPSPAAAARGGAAEGRQAASYDQAPAYRFLRFMVEELPGFFAEREKTAQWKYLAEWIPLVRQVHLHHQLPRPGTRESDYFDLVTADGEGKVLHLGQRLARATPALLRSFLDLVIAAKKARIKTGDVGGALLVAPAFGDDVLALYRETVQGDTGAWFNVEESFTGYAGFVRIGARRGFHLLLVQETGDGFVPLLAS